MNKHKISSSDRASLQKWKDETGISNEGIAQIAGVSKIAVAKWLNGKTKTMNIKSFVSLAKRLNYYSTPVHKEFPVNVYYGPEFKSAVLAALVGDDKLLETLLENVQKLYKDTITHDKLLKILKKEEYLDPLLVCILIVQLELDAATLKFNNTEKKLLYALPLLRKQLLKKLVIKVPRQ